MLKDCPSILERQRPSLTNFWLSVPAPLPPAPTWYEMGASLSTAALQLGLKPHLLSTMSKVSHYNDWAMVNHTTVS